MLIKLDGIENVEVVFNVIDVVLHGVVGKGKGRHFEYEILFILSLKAAQFKYHPGEPVVHGNGMLISSLRV